MDLIKRLEVAVYQSLYTKPRVRRLAAISWQAFWSLGRSAPTYASCSVRVFPRLFFGFHDKSPWDPDGRFIAAHHIPTGRGRSAAKLGIAILDPLTEETRILAETRAWNWQQGSQLQWLGGPPRLVFNDFDMKGRPLVCVVDPDGERSELLGGHVAAVSTEQGHGILVDFRSMEAVMPGYGYSANCSARVVKQSLQADHEMIEEVDLHTGTRLWTMSRSEIELAAGHRGSKRQHPAAISHCVYSPTGNKLAFFYIVGTHGNRQLHLMVLDTVSRELRSIDVESPSHYCWASDDALFVTQITDRRSWICTREPIGSGRHSDSWTVALLHGDGHVNYCALNNSLLIDTYTDRYRIQRLFVVDVATKSWHRLFDSKIPLRFSGVRRCDFHPRWHPQGKAICFDSGHTGIRSLCIMAG